MKNNKKQSQATKILFLCRGNVGRSVFGHFLFNKLTNTKDAFSAGTLLSGPEQSLGSLLPKTEHVIGVMKEEGIEMGDYIRKNVTKKMVKDADLIIDMAEQETVPDFVKEHPKRIVWEVEDPKGTNLEKHREIKDEIKAKIVEELIKKEPSK